VLKKPYIVFIIISFLTFDYSYSQFVENIKQSFETKPKIFLKFNSRNSIISTEGARINSINTGLEFEKKTRVGLGYEWLGSKIYRDKYILNENNIIDTVNTRLKLQYISLFGEYIFYNENKWGLSLPIILSFGKAKYVNKDSKIYGNKSFVFGYETQIIGQYSILKWIGVGAGIGYRIMLKDKSKINENFTSPIYILRIKIFFGKIIT